MAKLRKWAQIAEIAGAAAVVLSLLYVGYELRQNTSTSRVEGSQRLYELMVEVSSWENEPNMAIALVKAENDYDQLDAVERRLVFNLIWQYLNIWEQAYLSYQNGLLGEQEWNAWNSANCSEQRYWGTVISESVRPEAFIPGFFEIVGDCFDIDSSHSGQ